MLTRVIGWVLAELVMAVARPFVWAMHSGRLDRR